MVLCWPGTVRCAFGPALLFAEETTRALDPLWLLIGCLLVTGGFRPVNGVQAQAVLPQGEAYASRRRGRTLRSAPPETLASLSRLPWRIGAWQCIASCRLVWSPSPFRPAVSVPRSSAAKRATAPVQLISPQPNSVAVRPDTPANGWQSFALGKLRSYTHGKHFARMRGNAQTRVVHTEGQSRGSIWI